METNTKLVKTFPGKTLNSVWFAALMLTPIILWILPADIFDKTGYELCPSQMFFNVECFGCGITRAVMHLHHFDWETAFYFNYGVVWVYPFLVFLWYTWSKSAFHRIKQDFNFK